MGTLGSSTGGTPQEKGGNKTFYTDTFVSIGVMETTWLTSRLCAGSRLIYAVLRRLKALPGQKNYAISVDSSPIPTSLNLPIADLYSPFPNRYT
jgi:hypothetical protein